MIERKYRAVSAFGWLAVALVLFFGFQRPLSAHLATILSLVVYQDNETWPPQQFWWEYGFLSQFAALIVYGLQIMQDAWKCCALTMLSHIGLKLLFDRLQYSERFYLPICWETMFFVILIRGCFHVMENWCGILGMALATFWLDVLIGHFFTSRDFLNNNKNSDVGTKLGISSIFFACVFYIFCEAFFGGLHIDCLKISCVLISFAYGIARYIYNHPSERLRVSHIILA